MPLRLYRRPGRRHFYVRGTVLGQSVNTSCRSDDQNEAAQFADALHARLWHGGLVPERSPLTFGAAAKGYLAGKAEQERRLVGRLITLWEFKPVDTIGQAEFDAAAAALGVIGATANRVVFTPGAAVLHWAARRGACPWLRLERPKAARRRSAPPPSPTEVQAVIDRLDPITAAAVIVMVMTGARLGDVLGLDWADVDLDQRHVSLWVFKTRERRPVALTDAAAEALGSLGPRATRQGLVFPWSTRWRFYTAFRAAAPGFTAHQLRHAFATWLLRAGVNPRRVMAAGGWRSERAFAAYVHVSSAELRADIAALPDVRRRPLSA